MSIVICVVAVVLLFKAPWHSPPRHGCDSHRLGMRSLAIFSIPYTVRTLGRYYGLQSVFDTNGVTSSGATDPFTGWAELPPIKGGGSALYRCVCVRTRLCFFMCVPACAPACLRACVCVCVGACVRANVCVRACERACVRTCVCLRVRVCVLCAHMLACPSRACARP